MLDLPPPLLQLPEVPLSALRGKWGLSGSRAARATLRASLEDLGAVAITGAFRDGSARRALGAWAHCLRPGGEARESALRRQLAGGAINRFSITTGISLEGSLSPWPECRGAQPSTVDMRWAVQHAARALAEALSPSSRDSNTASPLVVERLDGNRTLLAAALKEATHLEHLHLYEAGEEEKLTGSPDGILSALGMHTDAGLLLAFVPPLSAEPGEPAAGRSQPPFLDVELPGGRGLRRLDIPSEDAVVFFIGEAIQHLRPMGRSAGTGPAADGELRPLPHALNLPAGFSWRAWYGVMFMLPQDSVLRQPLAEHGGQPATFGDWQKAAALATTDGVELSDGVGCSQGRRLADPVDACGAGEISCWMQCLSTVGMEHCTGSTWRPTGVGKEVEEVPLTVQCLQPGTGKKWPEETGEHCYDCKPMCALASGSAGQPSPGGSPTPAPAKTSSFCAVMPGGKGTTMYMDGFKWSLAVDDVCVAFLFPGLVLDTPLKFFFACLAVIAMGASIELIALLRRNTKSVCLRFLLQALTLTMAYLVMLFVMTYSLELFSCVILGLLLGPLLATHLAPKMTRIEEISSAETDESSAPHTDEAEGAGAGAPCCRMAMGMAHREEEAPPRCCDVEAT